MNRPAQLAAALAALILFTAVPEQARAQVLTLGGHGGYNIDDEKFFLGAQLRAGLAYVPPFAVVINPSIETYFIEDLTTFQVDANVLGLIGGEYIQTFQPYVGAGLAVNYYDDEFGQDTAFGFNLLGGASFNPGGAIQPFAQVRYTTGDGEYICLMGGVLFALGGY